MMRVLTVPIRWRSHGRPATAAVFLMPATSAAFAAHVPVAHVSITHVVILHRRAAV